MLPYSVCTGRDRTHIVHTYIQSPVFYVRAVSVLSLHSASGRSSEQCLERGPKCGGSAGSASICAGIVRRADTLGCEAHTHLGL